MARNYQRNYEDGGYGSHDSKYGTGKGGQARQNDDDKGFFGRIGDTISHAWDRIAGDDDQNRQSHQDRRSYGNSDSGNYDRGGYRSSSGSAGYGSSRRSHSPSTDYSSGYTGLYNQQTSYGAGNQYGIIGQTARGGYGSMSGSSGRYPDQNAPGNTRRESGYGRNFMDSRYGSSAGRGSAESGSYSSGSMSGYSGSGFGGSNYSSMGGFGGSSEYGSMSGGYSSGGGMDNRSAGSAGIGSSSGYGAGSRGSYGEAMGYPSGRDQYRSGGSGSMGGGSFGSGGGSFSGGNYGDTGSSMGGARSMESNRGWTGGYRGNSMEDFRNEDGSYNDSIYSGISMRSGIYGSSYSDDESSGLTDWAGQSRNFTEGDYGSSNMGDAGFDDSGQIRRNRPGGHNYAASKGEHGRR